MGRIFNWSTGLGHISPHLLQVTNEARYQPIITIGGATYMITVLNDMP